MDFGIGNLSRMRMDTIFKMNDVSPAVQTHLAHTYALLCAMVMAAGAGAYTYQFTMWAGWLPAIALFGVLFLMHTTKHMDIITRCGLAIAFGFLQGMSTGQLIFIALDVDPSLVVTAFMCSATIFVSFTLASLLAKRRAYFFLYGILSSCLTSLLVLSLVNMFARSAFLFSVELYAGLIMFSGFVIFDTQMIIEKASLGDRDFPMHALELFVDLVAIFVRVLIILLRNTERKEKKKSDSRR